MQRVQPPHLVRGASALAALAAALPSLGGRGAPHLVRVDIRHRAVAVQRAFEAQTLKNHFLI
jgi:hypothetical protein